jgi:hypothetical protein
MHVVAWQVALVDLAFSQSVTGQLVKDRPRPLPQRTPYGSTFRRRFGTKIT